MNKQERIQIIQTIRKRIKPVRMVSACFAAIGFLILFLTDQPVWSIFLIVFALILFGISSRKECLEICRITNMKQAKRWIQLRYVVNFVLVCIAMILLAIPHVADVSDLHIFYWYLASSVIIIMTVVVETNLDHRVRQADPEQPLSNEYR